MGLVFMWKHAQIRTTEARRHFTPVTTQGLPEISQTPERLSILRIKPDPATVHGRRLRLPQEICLVSRERLSRPRGNLTARQKSAEGVIGHVVGKANEALQYRKVEKQIGRAGNGDRRPEREGEVSRT